MVLARVRGRPAAPCVSSCSPIQKSKEKYLDAGARVTCRTLRQQLFLPVQKMKINGFNAGARVTCRALRQQFFTNSESERKMFDAGVRMTWRTLRQQLFLPI